MDLREIKNNYRTFVDAGDFEVPFLSEPTEQLTRMSSSKRPIEITAYLSERFVSQVRSTRKQLRRDPWQLYKTFRNITRGYRFEQQVSQQGRDGVFDLDAQRFDNDMTREYRRVINDNALMTKIRTTYPFLTERWRPVRIVAHPNHVRIRPVGLLHCHETDDAIQQRLVLVALGVYGVNER